MQTNAVNQRTTQLDCHAPDFNQRAGAGCKACVARRGRLLPAMERDRPDRTGRGDRRQAPASSEQEGARPKRWNGRPEGGGKQRKLPGRDTACWTSAGLEAKRGQARGKQAVVNCPILYTFSGDRRPFLKQVQIRSPVAGNGAGQGWPERNSGRAGRPHAPVWSAVWSG